MGMQEWIGDARQYVAGTLQAVWKVIPSFWSVPPMVVREEHEYAKKFQEACIRQKINPRLVETILRNLNSQGVGMTLPHAILNRYSRKHKMILVDGDSRSAKPTQIKFLNTQSAELILSGKLTHHAKLEAAEFIKEDYPVNYTLTIKLEVQEGEHIAEEVIGKFTDHQRPDFSRTYVYNAETKELTAVEEEDSAEVLRTFSPNRMTSPRRNSLPNKDLDQTERDLARDLWIVTMPNKDLAYIGQQVETHTNGGEIESDDDGQYFDAADPDVFFDASDGGDEDEKTARQLVF